MSTVRHAALCVALLVRAAPGWAQEHEPVTVADADVQSAQSVQSVQPVQPMEKPEAQEREVDRGIASWYGGRFHGRRTASGERYDMHALTAAHPTLPFGTLVRVKSLVNGREVEVRINDRGPHVGKRIIDLSRAAATVLGLLQSGTGTKPVSVFLKEPTFSDRRN